MKLVVKLVMSLVGAGATATAVAMLCAESGMPTAGGDRIAVICLAAVAGWFIGLYAGRLICHEPPAK